MAKLEANWLLSTGEMADRIRRHQWTGTALGSASGWSDRLKLMIEQVLASPLVASLVCGPEHILIYNDAAARLYGDRHPAALGRPLPDAFPEGWATVAPFYERAFNGETVTVAGQPLDTRGEGSATEVFDALLTPVREVDGAVAYVHTSSFDIADRQRIEAGLRESEAKYRSLFQRMGQGFCELELLRDEAGRAVDQRYIAFNPAFERLFGIPVSEATGRTASEVFPDLEPWWHDAFDRIASNGQPERIEHSVASLGRWFEVYVYPASADRLTVLYEDVSLRRQAEIALRESEERQAFLLKFSDALRAEPHADAVANRALTMLLDRLRLDRCYVTYYRPAVDEAVFPYQLGNDNVPPLPVKVRLSDFPEAYEQVLDRTFVIEDDFERRGLSEAERANSKALGMRAMVASTVRRGEKRPLASMAAVSSRPRRWSPAEIALVEEVAERTWAAIERARAEEALRESEARLAHDLEATQVLQDISNQLISKPGVNGHFDELCDAARALMRSDCASIQAYDEASARLKLVGHVGFHPESAVFWEWVDAGVGSSCGRALSTGERVMVPDMDRFEAEPLDLDAYRRSAILSVQSTPLVARNGQVVGMMSTHWRRRDVPAEAGYRFFDILARLAADFIVRIRTEAALRDSEERYRTLFDNMAEGLTLCGVVRDERGQVVDQLYLDLNPAVEQQLGVGRDVFIGRRLSEIAPKADFDAWMPIHRGVAETGEPWTGERYSELTGRWYEMSVYRSGEDQLSVFSRDVSERKRAEIALRESEERQAFLLKLSDELRAHTSPEEIGALATRMTAAYLKTDRCYIAELPRGAGLGRIGSEYRGFGLPSLAGEYRFDDFPEGMKRLESGPLVIRDVFADASLSEADKRSIGTMMGIQGMLTAVLRKGEGNYFWCMTAATSTPREWTDGDLKVLEDVAERAWGAMERTSADVALRESEERFQQFATASAAGLWIRDAGTLVMEFVSPAVGAIYGVGPDALLGDVGRWAGLIVPDDRDVALGHLDEARRGQVAVHEFRIQRPADGAFRWIRNTDFPLRDDGHIRRIGGIAEDMTEAKLAAEHSAILLAELQHRVRNIMALLRSITNRTAERAESVPEYRDLMMGRLLAFARVQALLTRTANVSVGIASIVHDEVSVQSQHEDQYVLDGPDIALSPKAAEVLTLAIHELATNAVKYGALSVPTGRVTVRWSTFEKRGGPWLAFDWTEDGAPARPPPASEGPRRRGFGSELIEGRIPYELRGRGQVTIEPGGARCHLEFPLQEGASILETGAPQRATVFGGAIDMTGEPDLSGRRVLVVEDDYYLATDTVRALRGAGAEVMGPCATEEDARVELAEQRPEAVVVDINLGHGPSFKLAETLKDRGIPFVFTTGYDAEVIPAEFDGVERLEKPLQLRQIVGAVARLTAAG